MNDKIKYYGGLALMVFVLGSAAVSAYKWYVEPKIDTTVAVVAAPAPMLKGVAQVTTAVKSVKTYAPVAKEKLKLPPAVIADINEQVTGATTVAPSERRQTVTSVIDVATGETTLYVKQEPLPWFAVEHRGELRFDYGYKVKAGNLVPMPVGRLSLVHDFIQVKALHVGVNAAVDTDGTAFVGLGVGYRW